MLLLKTPKDVGHIVADNLRALRKRRHISMKELSSRAAVPYSTLKRFEHTGEISLTALLKIAVVLNCADGFEQLFTDPEIHSIQEIIDGLV